MIFCMKRMYERWIRAQPPQVFIILKGVMGWEGVGPRGKLGAWGYGAQDGTCSRILCVSSLASNTCAFSVH